MIVKDFLLSLDREKLCKTYYEMYDAKDEVAQAEAKEHKGIWPPPCVGYAYQPKRPKQKSK